MSNRVFIIHGWEGTPEEGWFPWLKKELDKKGIGVKVPAMPHTGEPVIGKWVPYLKKQVGKVDSNTFLVGHSMGCQTILRYLEGLPKSSKVGGIVLVAGFMNLENLTKEEQVVAKPWLTTRIDLDKVKAHTNNITAIFSTNDEWVPISDSEIFIKKLGAKVIVLKNKGHFSGDDGIKKLPIVLKEVLRFSDS
ncbi:MAG: alpha/beta hydrolase [Microgenomates group bacterium]